MTTTATDQDELFVGCTVEEFATRSSKYERLDAIAALPEYQRGQAILVQSAEALFNAAPKDNLTIDAEIAFFIKSTAEKFGIDLYNDPEAGQKFEIPSFARQIGNCAIHDGGANFAAATAAVDGLTERIAALAARNADAYADTLDEVGVEGLYSLLAQNSHNIEVYADNCYRWEMKPAAWLAAVTAAHARLSAECQAQ